MFSGMRCVGTLADHRGWAPAPSEEEELWKAPIQEAAPFMVCCSGALWEAADATAMR